MDFVKTKEIIDTISQLDKDSKETIMNTLKIAEHIEKESKNFYEKEVKKNIGNELEAFFRFMVREEETHLEKINELEEKIGKNELSKISFPKNNVLKIRKANIGKEEMTSLLYALWREKKAEDFYIKASKKTIGTISKFFSELADFEKEHVNLLEEYVERAYNTDELIMG